MASRDKFPEYHNFRLQNTGIRHLIKREMKNYCGLAILLCAVAALPARSIDVATIIQRSVAANHRDWDESPDYAFLERDSKGKGTKTYRVLMLQGSPYKYLLEVNRKPLSPKDQKKEQQKLQQTIQDRLSESPQQRKDRIAKYQKERRRDHLMMEQLSVAFDFQLTGEQKLDGFDVYVLNAEPRPGYDPPNMETKALTGMHGKLWIDKKTFEWVKVEAEVVHPVTLEGFLARVEPGTHFELEKMPVANGVWLPKRFVMKARAKILFIFSHNRQETETYWDYRKGFSIRDLDTPPSESAPSED